MYVIFLLPLVFSVFAAVMIGLGDAGLITKSLLIGAVIAAAGMQFFPSLLESVHFLVPLFLQLFVIGWWYIASQLE